MCVFSFLCSVWRGGYWIGDPSKLPTTELNRWNEATSYSSMGSCRPPSRSATGSLDLHLLSNFNGLQGFSGFYILKIPNFSVLNRVTVFLSACSSFFLVCVCGGGVR